jgi:hypothetical protein
MKARTAAATVSIAALLGAGGCGDTLQDQQIAMSIMEPLVTQARFPVYWLGGAYEGLKITRATRDAGGAYDIQYGDCTKGGESECTVPLEIVTSPDNSFVPGGEAAGRTIGLRDTKARESEAGRAISTATGPVVVSVYAKSAKLARSAAETMVAIGAPQAPGGPLEPAGPPTPYGEEPLPAQQPPAAPTGAEEPESARNKG